MDDVGSLCLLKECGVEERFGTCFTERILGGEADQISMKEVKKVIGQLDRQKNFVCRKLQQWQEMGGG